MVHRDAAVGRRVAAGPQHQALPRLDQQAALDAEPSTGGSRHAPGLQIHRQHRGVVQLEPLADRAVHHAGGGHDLGEDHIAHLDPVLVHQPVAVVVHPVAGPLALGGEHLGILVVAVGAAVVLVVLPVAVLVVVGVASAVGVHAVVPGVLGAGPDLGVLVVAVGASMVQVLVAVAVLVVVGVAGAVAVDAVVPGLLSARIDAGVEIVAVVAAGLQRVVAIGVAVIGVHHGAVTGLVVAGPEAQQDREGEGRKSPHGCSTAGVHGSIAVAALGVPSPLPG